MSISVDALNRPKEDGRLVALSLVCALVSGLCLGAAFLEDFPAKPAPVAFALGVGINAFVALISLSFSKVSPVAFLLLLVAGGCAAPLPGLAMQGACDRGSAPACYAAADKFKGAELDRAACERDVPGACERLIDHDGFRLVEHCEMWMSACGEMDSLDNKCGAAERRCKAALAIEASKRKQAKAKPLTLLKEADDAGTVNAMNSLAWKFATSRNASERDGSMALYWARKAVSLDPRPPYVDTLAAAHAEAGQWDEAIAAQEKAIASLSPDASRDIYEKHLASFKRHEPIRE